VTPSDLPEGDVHHPHPILLPWAEVTVDFLYLPPRLRAQLLVEVDREVRAALAVEPDTELAGPEQIRQINQAFGFEVIPLPPRQWCFEPDTGAMRVIGGME
jgi:hypothetical protein